MKSTSHPDMTVARTAWYLLTARSQGAESAEIKRWETGANEHQVSVCTTPPGAPAAEVLQTASIPTAGIHGEPWSPETRVTTEWADRKGNGWRVRVTPKQGRESSGADHPISEVEEWTGMEPGLRFQWTVRGTTDAVERNLRRAAEHIALPVTLNGATVEPKQFLSASAERMETLEASIGVVYNHQRKPVDRLALMLIGEEAPERYRGSYLLGGLPISGPTIAAAHRRVDGRLDEWNGQVWHCRVELDHSSRLQWHSRAHRAEWWTAGHRREIERHARRALYRTLAEMEPPPLLGHDDWVEGNLLGIAMPEPVKALEPWTPPERKAGGDPRRVRREEVTVGINWIVGQNPIDHSDLHVLAEAADASGIRLWRGDQKLEGYGWYDELPLVVAAEVKSRKDGTTTNVTEERQANKGLRTEPVDRITIELLLDTHGGRRRKEAVLDGTMAYGYATGDGHPLAVHYTTAAKEIPEGELVRRIRSAGAPELIEDDYRTTEDRGAVREVRYAAEAIAVAIRGNAGEEHTRVLHRQIEEHLRGRLRPGERIEAACNADGGLTITVPASAERAPTQRGDEPELNRTAAWVLLFGAMFGSFCIEGGTTPQAVGYGGAVGLVAMHFIGMLKRAMTTSEEAAAPSK